MASIMIYQRGVPCPGTRGLHAGLLFFVTLTALHRMLLTPALAEIPWEPFAFSFVTPAKTASLQVWIHSYTSAKVVAYLDDLEIVPLPSLSGCEGEEP